MDWKMIIEPYKADLLTDLKGLLRIASVKDVSTASEQAPFGQGIKEALHYMLALGERDGFRTKNVDDYAAHLEIGAGKKVLGILSHLDVVPADSSQWDTDPFEPVIRDGKLYARGSLDDKGPALVAYYAIKIIKELGFTFHQRIRLIYGTDEETDWQDMDYYFRQEDMPDFGIVPDGIFPMIYAEKGVASIEIEKQGFNSQSLLSLTAGSAYNLVADKAEATILSALHLPPLFHDYLEHHALQGSIKQTDRHYQLQIMGKTAHAAAPSQGVNAGLHLVHFLKTLDLDQAALDCLTFFDEYFYEDTVGQKTQLAFQNSELGDVTVNTAFLNLSLEKASIGLNLRYPADYPFNQKYEQLTHLCQRYGYNTRLVSHQKPSQTSLDTPETKLLLETYRKHTGDQTPPLAIGGITYGRVFERGITFGPAFLGKPATLHQPNEYWELDDLFKALEIYLDAFYQLATLEGAT